jgi:hypothetical protein
MKPKNTKVNLHYTVPSKKQHQISFELGTFLFQNRLNKQQKTGENLSLV